MSPDLDEPRRTSGRVVLGAITAAVILLATTLLLGGTMLRQARALDSNAEVTSDIINANVRTLGQVQRELLRLGSSLRDSGVSTAQLDLHRGFVGQRMRETQLSYQLQTLGTDELLADARGLAARWQGELDARVSDVIASWPADRAVVEGVIEELTSLERAFNDLVSAGEINRKAQAGQANDVTVALLHQTRRLVAGMLVTFVGFLALAIVAVMSYRRFDAQREEDRSRLVELHAEAAMLSEVAARTGNMVVITDGDGLVEWVNEAFERTTGYTSAEVVGRRPGHVLQGPRTDPTTVAMMREHVADGEAFRTEIRNYTKAGQEYWADLEVRPVHDDAGSVVNFIAVQSDITGAKKAAALLERAKDDAEHVAEQKAHFLASMSHEIRTPLNAVIGLTELLLDTSLDDDQREYVRTAHDSGALLLDTVNDILTFSAAEAGRVELESRSFDLTRTVEQTVTLLDVQAARRGITVRTDLPDRAVLVQGDEVRVQQALVNLVGNAVKFTDVGGVEVALETTVDDGTVDITLAVSDSGIGIPAARLDSLFEAFTQVDSSTTRRFGGTGLGLAITDRLVSLMGGTIDVTSTVGRGSVFTIRVGLPAAPGLSVLPAVSESSPNRPSLRVLVAEDDPVNQMVATHMLERLGHRSEVVDDGRAAVDAVTRGGVDVVLMDVQMPGMDGIAATSEILARSVAPPPIIALTANALQGDRERYLRAGMSSYLSKPFRLHQLDECLREVAADVTEA